MALVRERTIPTQRPPPVGEISILQTEKVSGKYLDLSCLMYVEDEGSLEYNGLQRGVFVSLESGTSK